MTTPLPYSQSTGSAFNAYEKLHRIKNYHDWCTNMKTMLMSLRQWALIDGTLTRSNPVDPNAPTPQEVSDITAFDLQAISAYQEDRYRIGDSAKSVIGTSVDPKTMWDILEQCFSA